MATRRKTTKGKAAHRAPARKGGRNRGDRTPARTGGARRARGTESARQVRARPQRAPTAGERRERDLPGLRLADSPAVEEGTGRSAAADREAAELARRIEAAVGSAGDTLRTGPATASDQLRVHREQMEEAARRQEEARDLPGAATLGLELAVGALRLVGSMATAPLRLGLALLRRGAQA